MKPVEILLVDLNPFPVSCPRDRCAGLPGLLTNSLPGEVHLQTIHTIPSNNQAPKSPNIIFLRPSTSRLLSDTVRMLRNEWNRSPILSLFCSGWEGANEIFGGLQNGLEDYLTCPYREIDLFPRIQRLVLLKNQYDCSIRTEALKERLHLESLVGESKSFLRAVEKIPLFANSDATILITGETGTGKELFARAIHYESQRQGRPFVPINCGAIPDHLFENELFGHTRGAFTDACTTEKGLITEAEGGTLFLDEVDTLSQQVQVKLLRFLQDRKYRPLGCSKNVDADVRIIAACNTNLIRRVETNLFRGDLYHRLNVLSIHIPPLLERMDDIPVLAGYFLAKYGAQYQKGPFRLSKEALQKLLDFSWPGNVRELEGVIQRAVIMSTSPTLQPEHIFLSSSQREGGGGGPLRNAKNRTIEQFEQGFLAELLSRYGGNITHAARAAGKDRRTFQRLLKKYSLDKNAYCDACKEDPFTAK